MSVHPITQRPYSQGSQPPPYIDGGVITHLTGAIEGAQFDRDSFNAKATVPVRDIRIAIQGGGTGARAILVLPDGLVCDLDAAVGLGGLDKGVKVNQTAYTLRAYANLSGGVVGLMAVQTGTAPTLPAGIVWQSPILAVLITDGAGNAKAFVDLRNGRQSCTEDDGNDIQGWPVLVNSQGAGTVSLDLNSINAGADPGAVEGVSALLLTVRIDASAAAAVAETFMRDPNTATANLFFWEWAVQAGQVEMTQVRFYPADRLTSAPNLNIRSPAVANSSLTLRVVELEFDW
jgi:hypothetical protein